MSNRKSIAIKSQTTLGELEQEREGEEGRWGCGERERERDKAVGNKSTPERYAQKLMTVNLLF